MRRREAITLQGRRPLVSRLVPIPSPPPPPPPEPVGWVDLAPAHHPSARSLPGLAYDPGLDKGLLWNGFAGIGILPCDTWLYDWSDNDWTDAAPTHHPTNAVLGDDTPPPGARQTAWDGIRVVNINSADWGFSNSNHGVEKAWGFSSGDWSVLQNTGTVTYPIILPDLIANVGPYMLVIGGWSGYPSFTYNNKIFKWNNTAFTFTEIFPSVVISPKVAGQIAYNGTDAYYYGTIAGGGSVNYLYKWNVTDEDWDLITTADAPPWRQGFAFAWDAISESFILFGGRNTGTPYDDTWQFKPSVGNWVELDLATSPENRWNTSMVSTPNGLLLFGGDNAAGTPTYYSNTWTLEST